ncbi:hypothetical protein R6Q59_028275, partial [Mikania micrantha]
MLTTKVTKVVRMPSEYIVKPWMKDVLPKRIFEIQYHYGVDNSPEALLRNEILDVVADCVDLLRYDPETLSAFASK